LRAEPLGAIPDDTLRIRDIGAEGGFLHEPT